MLQVQALYFIIALGYYTALIDILLEVCTITENFALAMAK
jgi:hypothetical protein